ncbi:MAG TPA: LemA family protein [Caulobacterales bacterium]|nr:LemA family protein [Caulobacterales bacterium]
MIYVAAGLLVAVIVLLIVLYNGLIARRQMANNGWADIDVQLKRRADLVPQLVSIVQGYAAHERQLFADIAERRSQALAAADDPARRGAAETELSRPVARMIALAEGYPELKASQNFLDLQNQLADTENKIEMARRFYNGAVRELNTLVESFPSNFVAGLAGVGKRSFFETEMAARAAPQINLGNP